MRTANGALSFPKIQRVNLSKGNDREDSKISDSRIAGSHSEDGGRVFFEPGKLGKPVDQAKSLGPIWLGGNR